MSRSRDVKRVQYRKNLIRCYVCKQKVHNEKTHKMKSGKQLDMVCAKELSLLDPPPCRICKDKGCRHCSPEIVA